MIVALEWQEEAEKALRALWGSQVSCTVTETLRGEGWNRVYRLAVMGGPVASVILKATDQDRRFCKEWAGCAMLGPLGMGPVAYTGDAERRFFLMEDLGAGESLADKLTGHDPEAATAALLAYARTLGELHAKTQGQEARWNALLRERGGTIRDEAFSWLHELAPFRGICERHGLAVPAGFDEDLRRICEAAGSPGDYCAFTPADCCPDNHFVRGDRVIFFDCERAEMRHALLDAAYFFAPFPTCWCTSRLPDGMPGRMLAAYRERFSGFADFEEQLTLMLAGWVLTTLVWSRAGDWDADRKWGLVTMRQRHLHRLENLLARPDLGAALPAVGAAAEDLYGVLKARWTDVGPMPLFAAFRGAFTG